MKHNAFLVKYVSFFLAAVLLTYSAYAYMPIKGEADLYSKVLRLHVIAESDNELDQSVKLLVRDRLLCELDDIYAKHEASDLESAKQAIMYEHDMLVGAANEVLSSVGVSYTAQIDLTREKYPRKSYDNVTLPAGVYDSVTVKLGRAKGKNWWCVLFPTLCLASAVKDESDSNAYVYSENGEKFIAAGFTLDEVKLITDSDDTKVKIKLKILEIVKDISEQKSNS